jgi:hypothetical protein
MNAGKVKVFTTKSIRVSEHDEHVVTTFSAQSVGDAGSRRIIWST